MVSEHTARRCAFCGKPAVEAQLLFVGRDGVTICAECVLLSSQVIAEEQPPGPTPKPASPRPWWRR